MKAVNLIVKILAALAAVAGVVYVIATYGDKIVAWAKRLLNRECWCCDEECCCCECEEEAAEEAAEEEAVQAEEADFEG